ncbi:hypothetical protein [Ewingella americana]|uniref:hypothetical protein n=1 Tax=Ewingella americana TaxID=41202 RepID=UPI00163970F1|nr:hypothetical protein [Ewingella americana]QMV54071.1 hypothetical protein GXP68_22660 [Ewingella americana]
MKKIALMLIAIIAPAMTLAGCATEAVLPSKAKVAPPERIYLFQNKTSEQNSKLIVVRDSGYLGSGCYTGVYINGQRAAILDPAEKASFYLKPGEVSVGVKGEGKVCVSDAVASMRDFNLTPNGEKAVRLFADPSGNVDIKPLPNE